MMLQPLFTPGQSNNQSAPAKQLDRPVKSEPLPVPVDQFGKGALSASTPPEKAQSAGARPPEPATVVQLNPNPINETLPVERTYEALGSAAGAAKSRW